MGGGILFNKIELSGQVSIPNIQECARETITKNWQVQEQYQIWRDQRVQEQDQNQNLHALVSGHFKNMTKFMC